MPKKPVFIYALKCPRTGDVRYIGQTNNLKARLKEHLKGSSKLKNHLGNWLRSLKGEKPILAVLHEVAEGESWAEEERRYIFFARGMGMDLVNSTDGGEGNSGPRSPEQCAALRGPKSSAHRAAMSAAKKGVPLSPAAAAAARKQCAAMSAAKTGVPLSPQQCADISAAKTGVPWSLARRAAQNPALKGVPWSPARRAAHERRWGTK